MKTPIQFHPLTQVAILGTVPFVVLGIRSWETLLGLCIALSVSYLCFSPSQRFFRWVLVGHLAAVPVGSFLFILSGWETTGGFWTGVSWGMERYALYSLRIFAILLMNLLFVAHSSIRRSWDSLRWLQCPEPVILFLVTVLRFIPQSFHEVKRIIEIQRCRGLDWKDFRYPRYLFAILVPLFIAQMNRAVDLSLSLEIRYFQWRSETKRCRCTFGVQDGAALMATLLLGWAVWL